MPTQQHDWPRWLVGPNGERRVFASPQAVPPGWRTRAEAEAEDAEPQEAPRRKRGRPRKDGSR